MTDKKIIPENADPKELADLIDTLFSEGTGHINILSGGGNDGLSVQTVNSTDCSPNRSACCQPTEEFD